MAEVIAQENQSGKVRSNKNNPRVDMTPMVDLNFLLLMFFMFTSTFSKPNVMDLGLPAKGEPPTEPIVMDQRNQVTFILGKDNHVFYHQSNKDDLNTGNLKETDFSGMKISKIISEAYHNATKPENFTIIIKPTNDANYKNFVDMLDNIAIAKKERYGVTDIKPWETKVYNELIQ